MTTRKDIAMLRDAPEPPEYLTRRILERIKKEERRSAMRQFFVSASLFAASAVASAFCVLDLDRELSRSGFLSFASLFVSDFSSAIANFHELAFSLVESFPALPASFLLASMIFMVWFAALATKKMNVVRRSRFGSLVV
jgi:hypothetical protein